MAGLSQDTRVEGSQVAHKRSRHGRWWTVLFVLVCVMMSSACMPPYERIPTNAEIEAVLERERAFRCGACVSLGPDIAERIVEGLPNPVEYVFLTAVRKDGGVLVRERSWPFTGMHYYWLVGDLDGEPEISGCSPRATLPST